MNTATPIDARTRFPCSTSELERRWAAVRIEMEERGIDFLVIQNSSDWVSGYVRWFTDIPGTNGYPRTVLFPREGEMIVIHQGPFGSTRKPAPDDPFSRGVGQILNTPSYPSINFTRHYDSELAISELKRRAAKRIGLVNTQGMQYDFCAHLKESLDADFVDATDFVDEIKAVKSPQEQQQILACAKMHDEIFADLAKTLKPGMRDWEVSARARYVGNKLGSEQGITLGSSSPMGRASVFAQLAMQGRELRKGDHLALLVELNGPGGQYTELARIFVFGKPSTELSEALEMMKAAQTETLKRLKPGVFCSDIFAAHNSYMRGLGLPEEARLYAHGQGYDMVERPLIRHDETMAVAANMNFAVHPAYVTQSVHAVICDNYIVTDDGSTRPMHTTPQTLIEIDA